MPEEEVAYDVITGISVGSINALFLSFFAKGNEKKASEYLTEIWKNIKKEDAIESRSLLTLPSIFSWKYFYDTTPLRNFIR